MNATRPKVLILGLDGATFNLIKPWIAEGRLPNLAGLIADGAHGPLQSTLQPITAPAWTTFLTGVNEGKHGIYNFIQRRPGSYQMEVTNSSHNQANTIFDIASRFGLRSIAINVPYTFPPRPINGVMVGGPFMPVVSPQIVHPPEFFDTLKKIAPDYFVMPSFNAQHPDPLEDYAQKLLQEIELRERLSLYLMEHHDWDLFMVVFMAIDEAQHAFWKRMQSGERDPQQRFKHVIRSVYERADQAVGNILDHIPSEIMGETTIFVVSDHGGGELRWMINLNRWLADVVGVLRYLPAETNRWKALKSRAAGETARLYQRYIPPGLRAFIRNRLGTQGFDKVKATVESAMFATDIDWVNTQAYAMGAGGNIFINLKGREPQGRVAAGAEYEALCQTITTALMNLNDPEKDTPIFRRVYRRTECYQGPTLDAAPDLVAELANYTCWSRGRYHSQAPMFESHTQVGLTDIPLTGVHRPEGILIAKGRGIRQGATIKGSRLLDMAPTILALLSVPATEGQDGDILDGILTADALVAIEQRKQTQAEETQTVSYRYNTADEEIITEHLRALGYL